MKNMISLYETPFCRVEHNQELCAVQVTWKEMPVHDVLFRETLNRFIDALRTTNSHIIIADARKMQMIRKEDRDWIISEWYPKAIKAGYRYRALIVTEDSYNDFAMKQILETYNNDTVETGYFNSFKDAVDWVKNKVIPVLNKKEII